MLAGGGALGAWQAGFLERLCEAALPFGEALAFSIGSLNGAAYCCGRLGRVVELWRNLSAERVFALDLRLRPLSVFSNLPLHRLAARLGDDAAARRAFALPLSVVSVSRRDGRRLYARFAPEGRGPWDAPLAAHLAASCAIPVILPPVTLDYRGRRLRLVDGGVWSPEPMHFLSLARCRDVVVLEMIREEEMGRRPWGPIAAREQRGRELCFETVSDGIDSLLGLSDPPRVFRAAPSRVLDFSFLGFFERNTRPALGLGRRDAEAFLADPSRSLASRRPPGP